MSFARQGRPHTIDGPAWHPIQRVNPDSVRPDRLNAVQRRAAPIPGPTRDADKVSFDNGGNLVSLQDENLQDSGNFGRLQDYQRGTMGLDTPVSVIGGDPMSSLCEFWDGVNGM